MTSFGYIFGLYYCVSFYSIAFIANHFILVNQQRHIIITLVWVRINCKIENGKTRFTSWGKSMTESKCYNYLDSEMKDMNRDMNRERWC